MRSNLNIKKRERHSLLGYMTKEKFGIILLVAPCLAVLFIVFIYPLFYSFYSSFFKWDITNIMGGGQKYIGLQNYKNALFSSPEFWNSLRVTLIYTAFTLPVEFAFGLVLALTLDEDFKGKKIIRILIMLPILCGQLVLGLLWKTMYLPQFGIISYIIRSFSSNIAFPLESPRTAIIWLGIVDIWWATPFMMLFFLAGLQSIPKSLYEAASVDGATPGQLFWHITIPNLKNIALLVLIIRTTDILKVFGFVYALTRGGPGHHTEVVNYFIYKNSFQFFKIGYAAAISIIFLVIIFIIIIPYIRVLFAPEKEKTYV